MDEIEKLTKNEFNQAMAKHLDTYITYLNTCCKIPFHMYTDQGSKALKLRDLTGLKKLKLFKKIKIPEIFPSLTDAANVQTLWENFKKIYDFLWSNNNMDEEEIEDFTKKLKVG